MASAYAPEVGGFSEGFAAGQDLWFMQKYGKEMGKLGVKQEEYKTTQARMDLEARQKMLQIYQQKTDERAKTGVPATTEDSFRDMADAALLSGQPQQAMEIYGKLAKTKYDAAHAQYYQSKTTMEDLQGALTRLNPSSVHDQKSWEAFWQAELQLDPTMMHSELAQRMMNQPYSDDLRDQLTHTLKTEVDKARISRDKALERKAEAETGLIPYRKAALAAQAESSHARATYLKKHEGTTSDIKTADVNQATDVIGKTYDLTDPTVKPRARALGRELEEVARDMQQEDPKLSLSQARTQAFAAMEANGRFSGMRSVRQGPGSVNAPLKMPTSPKELKPNNWYKTPKGTYWFDGTEFVSVDEMRQQGSFDPGAEVPDDEEDTTSEDEDALWGGD